MKKYLLTEQIISKFRKSLVLQEKSDATIEKYYRDVSAFALFAGSSYISKDMALAYKNKLKNDGYAARSINSMIASINSLFVFLGCPELKINAIRIQKQIFCPEEKELSKAEYERLVWTAEKHRNIRLSLILQTICSTGMRISELKFITVDAVKRGEAVVACKGKTRTVFIVRDLRKKLLRYMSEQGIKSGSIFVTRTGREIGRTNIWREMKNLCREANVDPQKVFPHNLRHLFARIFYKIEKDIAKLADILGHSNINTTRIYIISTGIEHRRRMENMHLVL